MSARKGKIARLPRLLRNELNERIECSEQSPQLLDWLNASPEAKEIVQKNFAGAPIDKQNLSNRRQGGFQEWLVWRELWAQARTRVAEKLNVKNQSYRYDVQSNRPKLEIQGQKVAKPLMENEIDCGKEENSNAPSQARSR